MPVDTGCVTTLWGTGQSRPFIRNFNLRSQVKNMGKICLNQSFIHNGLWAQRIYILSLPFVNGYSLLLCIPSNARFLIFCLRAIQITVHKIHKIFPFILPRSTRQPKIYSYVKKIEGHLFPLHPPPPSYSYACLFRKRDNYETLHFVGKQLGFLQHRHRFTR
jgi:hypothetical protein